MLTVLGNALLVATHRNRHGSGDIDWSDRFLSNRRREERDGKHRFNVLRDLW